MNLLARVCATAWAIDPSYAEKMLAVLERHDAGVKLDAEQIRSAIGRAPKTPNPRDRAYEIHQGVAIVPVQGVLEKHASDVQNISGPSGTSYEQILTDLRTALADPEVGSVLLHIESPGGAADAMGATSDLITAADAAKPVWSLIDGLGASAGYGLAIGARRVFATPSAMVGSIGTMAMMRDSSAAAEKAGVKTRVVRSAPLKGGVAPGEPITDAHLADKQRIVDGLAAQFYGLVGARRNLSGDALAAVTDGRVHLAADAQALGLIDGIGSLEQVLALMTDPSQRTKPAAAAAHPRKTTMLIAPDKLVALQEAHPAHSALIGRMAIGAADKAPASEAEILAAIRDTEHASTKALLADVQAKLAKAEGDVVAAKTAHDALVAAHTAKVTALETELAEAKTLAGQRGVKALEKADALAPVDAKAAYAAKAAELKATGDKSPFRTIAAKFPELNAAYVDACQPTRQTQKGATK